MITGKKLYAAANRWYLIGKSSGRRYTMLANYHPAPSAASSRKGIPIINDVLDVTEPSSHTERALVIIIAVAARPSVLRPPSYARGAKYFPHFRARGRRKIPRGPPAIARRINIDKGSAYVPGGMHTRAIFPAGRVSRDVVVRGGGGGGGEIGLRTFTCRRGSRERQTERERERERSSVVSHRGDAGFADDDSDSGSQGARHAAWKRNATRLAYLCPKAISRGRGGGLPASVDAVFY